ncbi:hypothetical protein K0T92_22000 [Paenibacillus oenotherae]|uniref:Uncharacterized protein n=1 Tax=Paenibacillus oenotherae TaxID=1435645 RepID=A0ABS7DCL2_9BACL|nr:hypothetical protein [Paenibacillus oenotherae]MBW7477396.1 hypothetical protein [Paenibacillus oenotherae]
MQEFRLKEALEGRMPAIMQEYAAEMIDRGKKQKNACTLAGISILAIQNERKPAFSQACSPFMGTLRCTGGVRTVLADARAVLRCMTAVGYFNSLPLQSGFRRLRRLCLHLKRIEYTRAPPH